METAPKRRPRFQRTKAPNIHLTDRDMAIVVHVGRHRFVRSQHLLALVGGSQQQLIRRLRLLYDNHFLDRPRIQIDRARVGGGGSRPMVYALGNRGADLLAEVHGIPRSAVDWTTKNRKSTRHFLDHTLEVADFMIRLELAVREHPDIELVDFKELLEEAPKATRKSPTPAGWPVKVKHRGRVQKVSVYPDKIFALKFTYPTKASDRAFFFLEIDRGTMPLERSNLQSSSFYRKLLAYHQSQQLWRLNPKTAPYAFVHARVLTITTSPQRVVNFREASRRACEGKSPGFFLFTDRKTMQGSTDLLSLPWVNGRGESRTLLD